MGTATRVTAVCSYIPAAEVCAAPDVADILPGNGKSQTKSQTSSTFCCVGFLCSSATVIPTAYSFQITISLAISTSAGTKSLVSGVLIHNLSL